MEFKGSRTEQNLMAAFAGESQARNKYDFYASKAKKEGFEQIAAIFQETALNEKEHAKLWFKLFHGINSTLDNLWTQLLAKTTNGQKCTASLPKSLTKKASTTSHNNSVVLQQSKSLTKNVTKNLLWQLRAAPYLAKQRKKFGFAVTVVTST